MKRPLHEVVECLKKANGNIFVWVVVAPDGSENSSMRLSFEGAASWCVDYANGSGKGMVPFFWTGEEMFLGYPPLR